MSKRILIPALLLLCSPAFGQTITIGMTDFPLGGNAFPNASECLVATDEIRLFLAVKSPNGFEQELMNACAQINTSDRDYCGNDIVYGGCGKLPP
jgi:hypothetical protein